MTIGGDFGKAIEIAAPEIGLPVLAAKVIVGLVIVGLAGFVIWKVFFSDHAAQVKHDVVQAQANGATASAGMKAAQDAIPIIVKNYNTGAAIDAQTQEAIRAIANAKGADQAVDPALDDLGRRAVCLRLSAASLSGCQSLQPAGPATLDQ